MSTFTVKRADYQAVTCVSDHFIEEQMPAANGEYVKIYLYLLCCLKKDTSFSVSSLADLFQCTENDIRRALKYWESAGLLELSLPENPKNGDALEPKTERLSPSHQVPQKRTYSAAETSRFRDNAEMKQLLFVCEQYIGKPLSASDVQTIFYFYEELHFSTDLIEYLVEYSVSKGKRSLRYMEKVALAWHEKRICTVDEAKLDSKAYARECYQVLKALGINNHDPLPSEVDYVNRWTKQMGLSMELVLEACSRTIMQIHKPEFKYVDKILSEWASAGVRHLRDISALDAKHQSRAGQRQEEAPKTFTTKLHNFEQRTYDFDELEKKLFINT